ncbi:hypothetical protein Ancab_016251 [Ancistrocladus abbreviatus]
MVKWRDDQWKWEFTWRRELRYREVSLVRELLSWLAGSTLSNSTEDHWRCLYSNKRAYSVKSTYQAQLVSSVVCFRGFRLGPDVLFGDSGQQIRTSLVLGKSLVVV